MIATSRRSAKSRAARKPWVVSTLGEVAEFFGVSPSTVRTDWRAAGCPGTSGAYDLQEIMLWKQSRAKDPNSLAVEGRALSREKIAEILLAEERHRKLKLANDILEGDLVRRSDIVADAAELCTIIRSEFESLPDECEMMIPLELRADLKREIETKVTLKLKRLAGWKPVS